jgi:Fe-S-cluster containining protein
MEPLEVELHRARELDVTTLADAIESIGFECTRCGACCKGVDESNSGEDTGTTDRDFGDGGADPEPGVGGTVEDGGVEEHTATVFPDEVRALMDATDYDWRDVARPMPYGLEDGPDGVEGETFEWALATDGCGDCRFYAEEGGVGQCTVHGDRPLICRTYPFSVALGGTSQPMGEAVDAEGMVRAYECEGLGRDIDREDAEEVAATLKERAVRELAEAIAIRNGYEPGAPRSGEIVVQDSEGAKRPGGAPYR